jgi:hypothetical protein
MRTALVQVEAVSITCTHCEEDVENPSGSLMWTPEDLHPEEREVEIFHPSCGNTLRMPKGTLRDMGIRI